MPQLFVPRLKESKPRLSQKESKPRLSHNESQPMLFKKERSQLRLDKTLESKTPSFRVSITQFQQVMPRKIPPCLYPFLISLKI